MKKWINVKDQTPKANEFVLGAKNGKVALYIYKCSNCNNKDLLWELIDQSTKCSYGDFYSDGCPDYWMCLPAAPKEPKELHLCKGDLGIGECREYVTGRLIFVPEISSRRPICITVNFCPFCGYLPKQDGKDGMD